MEMPTLLDIAARNGSDMAVGLIDEASKVHPEIRLIASRTISGLNYRTRVLKKNPSVSFRDANDGTDTVVGEYENRLVETFILNPRWQCDKAVADSSEDGPEAYIAEEATVMSNAAFERIATQMYYGDDPKGFPKLSDSILDSMTIDAGGTTAGTGSSVYALTFGQQGVQWVMGRGGSITINDVWTETITGQNNKPLTGYVQDMLARIGLQVGNLNGAGRIKDLTEDVGKGLTDDLLADLLGKFRVGYRPDVLLMSRRSLTQLQKSRTATTVTGAPAPTPTEYQGVPIVATDSLLDTESLSA
ncbi:major capsid protein [Stratiformator vulcanicus]|uniref:Phage capsid family protein n=1 Tax=Stratiformator vulcanicus TaxID=2527980 RepID=A0A517R7E1_9PLAN|nr:hypothetical protein [Stratiformator vulcanicus]QDT39731.1 hypothetical protein Pan189_41400 [Stratiformator vulcanicus]